MKKTNSTSNQDDCLIPGTHTIDTMMTSRPALPIEIFKWLTLSLLIVTVLILNTYLMRHSQHIGDPNSLPLEPQRDQTEKTVKIPKIIHLSWSQRLVPTHQLQFVTQWWQHNPDWKIWFWTDKDFEALLNNRFPAFRGVYNRLKPHDKIVSRRYFIIKEYGGVWSDLDILPLRSLDPIREGHSCVLSQEPLINAKLGWRIDLMVGAAFFACIPQHPYFDFLLNLFPVTSKDSHTLAASGSVMMSRVYLRYRELTQSFGTCTEKNWQPISGADFINEKQKVDDRKQNSACLSLAEPNVFMPLIGQSYLDTLARECNKTDSMTSVRQPFCAEFEPLKFQNAPIPSTSFTAHQWFRSWVGGESNDQNKADKKDIFEYANVEKPPPP